MDVSSKRCRRFLPLGESHAIYGMEGGLGAGATRAQYDKAPLCDNFFRLLKTRSKDLFSHLETITEPYRTDYFGSKGLESLNVEDVMKKFHEFSGPIRSSFLTTLFQAIYQLLGPTTNSSRRYSLDYINGQTLDPPTTFHTLLENPKLNEKDFFMTLNYDLYLDREIFLYKNQRKIDYGFHKHFIQSSEMTLDFHTDFNYGNLSLYHLHGSLNWEYGEPQKLKVHQGAINPTYSGGPNICLVPPGQKQENNQFLKMIWDAAEYRLTKMADELIIIGCSLNPEDIELTNLIKKFINRNGNKKVKIIYQSDPDGITVENNYKAIIGKNYKSYDHGFNIKNKGRSIDFIFE